MEKAAVMIEVYICLMPDFTSSSGSYPIRPTGSDEWEKTHLNGKERVCEDDGKVWAASARL